MKHKERLILLFIFLFSNVFINAQKKSVFLWKDVSMMKKEKSKLYIFETADSLKNGVSVIICPGGSYYHLWGIKHEGFEVAKWLNSKGINAYVLSYRVHKNGYTYPAMIQDVQRAIQWVREHDSENKIGVMGFSAGGHLALMAGCFYDEIFLLATGIETVTNLKPDFIASVYPVVSMQDSLAHRKSRKSLLGSDFDKDKTDKFSMELQVKPDMPPLFLTCAKDDKVVKYQNSLALEKALINNNVQYKMALYETGGHGYGIDKKRGGEAASFIELFFKWLYETGIIK